MVRNRKPKIGDIYELRLAKGLAYIQYTHDGVYYGDLVRILPTCYEKRPNDFAELAQKKELYFIFTVLSQSLRKKEIEYVANQPVPEWARPFPIMRKRAGYSKDANAPSWYIGHGLQLFTAEQMQAALHVRHLTPEQKKLSLVEIWSASILASEIERGWLPEYAEKFLDIDCKKQQEKLKQSPLAKSPPNNLINHYLYFAKKSNATRAAQKLRSQEWITEVKLAGDGKSWLLLAKQPAPIEDDIEKVRAELEEMAESFDGEYDGWSTAV